MAVAYTATIGGFDYGFDFADQRIDIDDRILRLSVELLYRAIQEAQASSAGIAWDEIADASGQDSLADGITTFITVKLLDSWEINTLLVTGKFEVAGGNLIRADQEDPFRDNPLITYINFISQAGVRATFSTGSGLSSEQNDKLMGLPSVTLTPEQEGKIDAVVAETAAISAAQDDQLTEDRFVDLTFNKTTTITGTAAAKKISGYVAGTTDQVEVAVTYDEEGQYGLPESEGVV